MTKQKYMDCNNSEVASIMWKDSLSCLFYMLENSSEPWGKKFAMLSVEESYSFMTKANLVKLLKYQQNNFCGDY